MFFIALIAPFILGALLLFLLLFSTTPEPRKAPASNCKKRKTSGNTNRGLNRRPISKGGAREPQRISDRLGEVRISDELNGWIDNFGYAFWNEIKRRHPKEIFPGNRLLRVAYEDRYLLSPLNLRLLLEILGSAPHKDTSTKVEIETWKGKPKSPEFEKIRFFDNWHDPQMRIDVMRRLFPRAELTIWEKPLQCEHSRRLFMEFERGRFLEVKLDQGLSAWRTIGPWCFVDVALSVDQQAASIRMAKMKVEFPQDNDPAAKRTHVFLNSKWGSYNSD